MSRFPLPVQKVVSDPPAKGSTVREKEITNLLATHARENVKRDRAPSGAAQDIPARFADHATPHGGKK